MQSGTREMIFRFGESSRLEWLGKHSDTGVGGGEGGGFTLQILEVTKKEFWVSWMFVIVPSKSNYQLEALFAPIQE